MINHFTSSDAMEASDWVLYSSCVVPNAARAASLAALMSWNGCTWLRAVARSSSAVLTPRCPDYKQSEISFSVLTHRSSATSVFKSCSDWAWPVEDVEATPGAPGGRLSHPVSFSSLVCSCFWRSATRSARYWTVMWTE